MTEVWFYHLTVSRLEQALPGLIEKSLERGWRVAVQATDEARCEALDQHLWTYREDSFVPHARQGGGVGDPSDHPVWLTTLPENQNGANIRILIDGAQTDDKSGYERLIVMFDGHDPDAVAEARTLWQAERDGGQSLTYWQQNDLGGWERKSAHAGQGSKD